MSGDHKQPGNLGKGSDDFLGDPVAEKFLLWVLAHVHKGQHGDRRHIGQGESHLLLGGYLCLRRRGTKDKLIKDYGPSYHNDGYYSQSGLG